MPSFGQTSESRLITTHMGIQRVLRVGIIKGPDFTVVCGRRDKADQDEAFADGLSLVKYPDSEHNPPKDDPNALVRAVDVAPYVNGAIDWDSVPRFRALISYLIGIGDALGIPLVSGADWDRDWSNDDHKFIDWPHLQLAEGF